MARQFRKYGQVERILMHLQNAPIYYAKYKKQESKVNALMELIKGGVAKVTATEERKVNMRRSVTLEHYIGGKETTRKKILCSFKERIRNYIKSKLYLKQQLLRDAFCSEKIW